MNLEITDMLSEVNKLREEGKYQESVILAQNICLIPDIPEHSLVHAHLNASIALRLQKMYDKAKLEAEAAKSKNTDPKNNHFILFELASVLESQEEWIQAAAAYQEASTSQIEPIDDYGLRYRYLGHAGYCECKSGNPTGLQKLNQPINSLETKLSSVDMAKETGDFDRKYNLQVWLSKEYMHAWQLGDKSVELKLDTLFTTNPRLIVRQQQWQELKAKQ